MHQPFSNHPGQSPWLVSPADGAIEALMALNGNKPVGFDLINTPVGELTDCSSHSMCYEDFTLGQFFDGYIFLEPFSELEGCTVDEAFFEGKSWEEVKIQRPDPDWHGVPDDWEQLWDQILEYVDLHKRYADVIE